MNITPRPRRSTSLNSELTSRPRRPTATEPPLEVTATGGSGARPDTTSQTTTATTISPVSMTTVARQEPVKGISTELDNTRVAIPPIAGIVL